jgi:thiamine pyrophosphokinase
VAFETYPRDKNATDGQLAVERALQVQPEAIWLLGFLGGPRLDQAIANITLLVRVAVPMVLLDEMNECVLVRPQQEYSWRPEAGEIVSLVPMAGDATDVKTTGLRWPLRSEPLRLGDTRGLSNEPISEEASVSIGGGHLILTRHFPATYPLSPQSSVLSPHS